MTLYLAHIKGDIKIRLNAGFDGTEWGDFNRNDMGLVMIHEFGHTLGLKHDNSSSRSMNSRYPNGDPVGISYIDMPYGKDVRSLRASHSTKNINELTSSSWRQHPDYYGPTANSSSTNSPASSVPIRVLDSNRRTISSARRGTAVRVPFTVSNLSSSSKNVEVRFYMSSDYTIGNSDDHVFGVSRLNMSAGSDIFGEKWLAIPSNKSGYFSIGYKISPISGETNRQIIQITLLDCVIV